LPKNLGGNVSIAECFNHWFDERLKRDILRYPPATTQPGGNDEPVVDLNALARIARIEEARRRKRLVDKAYQQKKRNDERKRVEDIQDNAKKVKIINDKLNEEHARLEAALGQARGALDEAGLTCDSDQVDERKPAARPSQSSEDQDVSVSSPAGQDHEDDRACASDDEKDDRKPAARHAQPSWNQGSTAQGPPPTLSYPADNGATIRQLLGPRGNENNHAAWIANPSGLFGAAVQPGATTNAPSLYGQNAGFLSNLLSPFQQSIFGQIPSFQGTATTMHQNAQYPIQPHDLPLAQAILQQMNNQQVPSPPAALLTQELFAPNAFPLESGAAMTRQPASNHPMDVVEEALYRHQQRHARGGNNNGS